MNPDKEIRSDAKLKNLPAEALEDLWRFRNPEEGGTKLSYEEIAVEIPLRHAFTVSLSTLSEFYAWLRLKRRMDSAAERAMQARIELAKDGSLTPEDLERSAQIVFTAETLEAGDVQGYVALAKLGLARKSLALDARRINLLENAAAEAKAKLEAVLNGAKSQGGLTPETLRQIEEAAGLL